MHYKIFLSSPSDVKPERAAASRVIKRLNAELPEGTGFDLIMWEDDYYTADATFQEQIENPADCDLVVCIIWGRLGSELPEQFRDEDGQLPTGTEYEFEIAYKKASESDPKVPDILVYKKKSDPVTKVRDAAEAQRQLGKVDRFWKKWFRNEQGHFVAAFRSFIDTADFETYFESNLRRWLDDRQTPLLWTRGSPFRGLAPFDIEHAAIFFGRTREIQRARARALSNLVAGTAFLIILGPSGSGKSSLVRAGLLPRLMQSGGSNELPRLDLHAVTTPAQLLQSGSGQWSEGLARVLYSVASLEPALAAGDFDTPAALGSLLSAGGQQAVKPLTRALDRLHEDQGMVLVVDQLEEIFEWDTSQADAFCALLAELVQSKRIMVIATMRAEYQHRLAEIPALEKLCALKSVAGPNDPRTTLNIGRPGMADIRDMIVKPAAVAGLEYEEAVGDTPGLAARIEEESSPDTLPAMQLLLTELFKRRQGKMLTHAAFDDLGGVRGVMASSGDAVMREVPDKVADALPGLTRSLVQSNAEGVIVSKRLALDALAKNSDEMRLARALQNAGLLTSDGDSLRIAHESLIKGWDAMHRIVLQEEQNLAVFNRISAQFRGYQAARKENASGAAGAYLAGLPLGEALALKETWGGPALEARQPGVTDYIDKSARAARRKRWIANSIKSVLVAALILAGFFLYQLERSNTRAELREHIGNGQARLRGGEWARALSSAAAALDIEESAETVSLGLSALIEFSSPHFLREEAGPFAAVSTGPGDAATALSPTGRLVNLQTSEVYPRLLPDGPDGSDFSKYARLWTLTDGTRVVLKSDGDGYVISPGNAVSRLPVSQEPLSLFWSAQSALWETEGVFHLAMGTFGAAGRLLSCNRDVSALRCSETPLRPGLKALAFAPRSGQLVTASPDGVVLRDLGAGGAATALPDLSEGPANSLAWLAEESTVVAGLSQGRLAALNLAAETPAWEVISPALTVTAGGKKVLLLVPSPDAKQVAYDCAEERICIAEISQHPLPLTLRDVLYRRSEPLRDLIWSPSGEVIYAVHADGRLSVWSKHPETAIASLVTPAPAKVTTVAVDRARGRIISGDEQGRVTVTSPAGTRSVPLDQGAINHLAVNAEGDTALATARGSIVLLPQDEQQDIEFSQQSPELQRIAWIDDGRSIAATSHDALFLAQPDRDMETTVLRDLLSGIAGLENQTIGGVTAAPDGTGAVVSLSTGGLYTVSDGRMTPLLPPELTADKLSSLDIELSPDGQLLVTTRSDDLVRIYDLATGTVALELAIPTRDTKTVRFSPDGEKLAVLASSGSVHVWSLSRSDLKAEKLVSFDPAPSFRAARALPYKTAWIDWENKETLIVAHQSQGVLRFNLNIDKMRARLRDLLDATAH